MYGLVLEGGGSRGAYQAGACKALCQLGIEFSCVAGTSVGALNGSLLVQNEVNKLYDIWYEIDPAKVISFEEDELDTLNSGNLRIILKGIRKIINEKGLDTEPLSRLITNSVNENKVRNSPIDFGIVTFEVTGRKPIEIFKEQIPKGQLCDYLIASARFPGFRPKNIDGKVYLDGAVYNVLPVNMVKDKGCTDIIVIRTYGFGRVKKIETDGLNITEIAPTENLGFLLDFNNNLIKKNLKLGYFDAYKKINGLKGKKYYVKPLKSEEPYLNYFLNISDVTIMHIARIVGLSEGSPKRLLFEAIIPKLAELIGMNSNDNYEDIAIGIIEHVAEMADVERFKIYSVEELLTNSMKTYKPEDNAIITNVPDFIRRIEVASRINKNKIVSALINELLHEA